jgi:hypothetical protein
MISKRRTNKMPKKFIRGTFKFKTLKPLFKNKRVSNELVKLADARDYALETYTVENSAELHVDYSVEGNTKGICKELIKELKVEAKKYGSIEFVSEAEGVIYR